VKIKQIIYEDKYIFRAIFECEYCKDIYESTGYNTAYFLNQILPYQTCTKCKKASLEMKYVKKITIRFVAKRLRLFLANKRVLDTSIGKKGTLNNACPLFRNFFFSHPYPYISACRDTLESRNKFCHYCRMLSGVPEESFQCPCRYFDDFEKPRKIALRICGFILDDPFQENKNDTEENGSQEAS